MNTMDPRTTIPWYRQRWPWILIALPASSVVASFTTLLIAIHEPDGLVVDDYYKEGLAINQRLERDQYAQRVGLSARGRYEPGDRTVHLSLVSAQPIATQNCVLTLVHPTRAEHDRRLALRYNPHDATYRADLPDTLAAGHWHIVLEPVDGAWRLTGRVLVPGALEFALAPGGS